MHTQNLSGGTHTQPQPHWITTEKAPEEKLTIKITKHTNHPPRKRISRHRDQELPTLPFYYYQEIQVLEL